MSLFSYFSDAFITLHVTLNCITKDPFAKETASMSNLIVENNPSSDMKVPLPLKPSHNCTNLDTAKLKE